MKHTETSGRLGSLTPRLAIGFVILALVGGIFYPRHHASHTGPSAKDPVSSAKIKTTAVESAPASLRRVSRPLGTFSGLRLSAEDQNMPEVPVRVPIRPGEKELMIEYSQDSRQKALAAANRFGSNVCKAGLGFDVKGEAHMRVKGNRIQIASITTDNVSFHTEASPTEAFRAGVNYMQLTGNDENGACRGFYIITSASAANNDRRILEGYPVVSTEEAAQAAAEKLVNLEFPDGGYVYDRYPKPYQKLQMGGALPFETFTFVPPELRGHHDPVDCVKVTVQMGAPGWKHGDLALAGWEATGVVTHGQKPTITWPSAEVFGRYLKDRESQRKFLQTDPPPSTQPIASP